MNQISIFLTDLMSNPLSALFTIFSIVLVELVLSVDNAALIATMIKDLSPDKQKKALTYGIAGAYLFRGLSLVFVTFLIKLWWLKPLGGLYLIWMCYSYFKGKSTETTEDDLDKPANESMLYKYTVGLLGSFWATVVAVEFMDLTLSVDNVFAVVAMSDNIVLIIFGVFVGIIAMRFVAQKFVVLMEKYPIMETSAFIVIGILGLKLTVSVLSHFYETTFGWIDSEAFDMVMSGLTLAVFFVPVLWLKFKKK